MGIEHMGGEAPVHRQLVVSRHELVQSQRRNPADFRDRRLHLGLGIVGQPPLEIPQNRILGVAADADDIGKAELRAIGVIDPLERGIFRIGQPVEADAVLLGIGFGGKPRRALGLVGEIRMRFYQREAQFRRREIDRRFHRIEQLLHAHERPRRYNLFGNPRRIFEDVRQRRNKIILAAAIQIEQGFP